MSTWAIRSIWICVLQCLREIECWHASKVEGRGRKRWLQQQKLRVPRGGPRGTLGGTRAREVDYDMCFTMFASHQQKTSQSLSTFEPRVKCRPPKG